MENEKNISSGFTDGKILAPLLKFMYQFLALCFCRQCQPLWLRIWEQASRNVPEKHYFRVWVQHYVSVFPCFVWVPLVKV